jgi:hypothetical protein
MAHVRAFDGSRETEGQAAKELDMRIRRMHGQILLLYAR